jgi:hypothetical protein
MISYDVQGSLYKKSTQPFGVCFRCLCNYFFYLVNVVVTSAVVVVVTPRLVSERFSLVV